MHTQTMRPCRHQRSLPIAALFIALSMTAVSLAGATTPAAQEISKGAHPEGSIGAFLGEPRLEMGQVFVKERFPNVVVAVDGTVLATWGTSSLRLRRSEDGGETWGKTITIAKGFQGGGLTVDERSGDVIAFIEDPDGYKIELIARCSRAGYSRSPMGTWARWDGPV